MAEADYENSLTRGKSNLNTKSLEKQIAGASVKIENEITHLKNQIKTENARIEALTSKMHQLQQQTEIYTHECQVVMEKIKDSNWSFTKEVSLTILKIKKPIPEIIDLADKFMILLEQKEVNWKMFQASVRNYDSLKALMDKFNPENIREENVDLILTLWKNYNTVQPRISKTSRGASILLDWITSCMEYKIKKATLDGIKKSLSDVQSRIKEYQNNISEKKSLVATLEEKAKELKEFPQNYQNYSRQKEDSKKLSYKKSTSNTKPKSTQSYQTQTEDTKAATKLSKMLSPQSIQNLQSQETKRSEQHEEKDHSTSMNASCEVKIENAQVNSIFSSTYRFPLNFGTGYLTKVEGGGTIQRRSSRVEKILSIIANHDDRNNKDNVMLSDSKILFVKEKHPLNFGNLKNDLFDGDLRARVFEEDKTNSTYLTSARNPLSEHTNTRKKLSSTVGTNSGVSIGINSLRHDDSTNRSHNRNILTPRVDDDPYMINNSNLNSARSKRMNDENERNEEENPSNDESFAACCKKGINRLFCS